MKALLRKAGILALGLNLMAGVAGAEGLLINGAGSTFAYPLYSKWFDLFGKTHPEYQFNYQAIGSGGGIQQFTARTVDFGATDGPMTDEQLSKAPAPVLHLPTALGAVVMTYNIPGVHADLNFTQKALADIYLGKVTKWNDPEIQNANKGVKLPDQPIIVTHRSDGSGTTYIFTDFLSKVSKDWGSQVGRGTSVNWPVGLGGKGSEGVSGLIKQNPYSIGYVELIYALQNHISYGKIQHKDGKFVVASLASTSAAAKTKMPADFRVSITNSADPKAYPISGFTWLLVYKDQTDPAKGKGLVEFLNWMLKDGQKQCSALGYAPLPAPVVRMEEAAVHGIQVK